MEHRPRKRFGQHFLHDPNIIRRIVSVIDPRPGERLVEIGPGSGAITTGLLQAAGRLDAIELDRDLIESLARRCTQFGELTIHNADALNFELRTLHPRRRLRLIGNLPYNLSTPLLFRFLDQADCIDDMHFMLQREVVERIAARSGSRVYGRLSVMIQVYCRVEPLFDIGPGAFTPAPKVDSTLVRLIPHRPLPCPVRDPALLSRLVARAFGHRRKTLRNSLQGLIDTRLLRAQGLHPGQRAEELSMEDFVHLANAACKTGVPP